MISSMEDVHLHDLPFLFLDIDGVLLHRRHSGVLDGFELAPHCLEFLELPAKARPRCSSRSIMALPNASVQPHPQGKPAVGAVLPNHRGTAAGVAGVPRDLQHDLADRAPRLPLASPVPREAASICRQRCVGFNPVSQKPQAVQTGPPKRADPSSAEVTVFKLRLR
jgi:hypothetical protein